MAFFQFVQETLSPPLRRINGRCSSPITVIVFPICIQHSLHRHQHLIVCTGRNKPITDAYPPLFPGSNIEKRTGQYSDIPLSHYPYTTRYYQSMSLHTLSAILVLIKSENNAAEILPFFRFSTIYSGNLTDSRQLLLSMAINLLPLALNCDREL